MQMYTEAIKSSVIYHSSEIYRYFYSRMCGTKRKSKSTIVCAMIYIQ